MLQIDKLNSFYGNVQAVWDVSFEVKEGEILAIIGTNGAGKTTIMQSIVGLVSKTGAVKFQGNDISDMPAHKMAELGISYVPEGRKVFPEMTVMENLVVGGYNKRSRAGRQDMISYVLDTFPRLKERLTNLAGNLSGGEQQMLAIGRGLMARPRLLLLDEPSLGIAPILSDEIFKKIVEIKKEITIVLVEQHLHHALSICDRGYVIENGRISLDGTGEALRNNRHIQSVYLGM
ncbi:ABC transporter ATP-binding protein [Pollutimonas harenae]|uniref:ABC transporter ATP-binding protein n=1 Tax=Pollutimonas harenae TaxID=657015 RepID=A0A853GUB6_9BURK|nr:ABC transporter ATP-binding protein [Pollutimonas harenae]NYT84376.1 ABC transporter ATP-binding protein [Pollutimonas harenae]TEA73223.1 ABC transporter ATP-binding protein [Pollutimonas harenae]